MITAGQWNSIISKWEVPKTIRNRGITAAPCCSLPARHKDDCKQRQANKPAIFSHQGTCTSEEQQSFPPRLGIDFSKEAWEIQDPLNLLLDIKKQNIKSILFGSFHYSLRKHILQIISTKHNFIALFYHLPRCEVGKQLTVKLIWQPPIT